jgi:hypothetical protein
MSLDWLQSELDHAEDLEYRRRLQEEIVGRTGDEDPYAAIKEWQETLTTKDLGCNVTAEAPMPHRFNIPARFWCDCGWYLDYENHPSGCNIVANHFQWHREMEGI